jgi:hypothetical protein
MRIAVGSTTAAAFSTPPGTAAQIGSTWNNEQDPKRLGDREVSRGTRSQVLTSGYRHARIVAVLRRFGMPA